MFLSLKTKIFLLHLFLIVVLLGSLSYKHYINAVDNYINNITTYYTNSSSSILTNASLAISGANYGNMQRPSFIEEVTRNKKLLYIKVKGLSDNTSLKFSVFYNKKHQTIYRNEYPKNYEQQLKNKLKSFISKLDDLSSDKVKLNFLIERVKDKQKQYHQSIEYSKNIKQKYLECSNREFTHIDFDDKILHLSLKTTNKNGGIISLFFDISELVDIKFKIIKDLLLETSIALILSIIILILVSNKIIGPLNKLSKYISNDSQSIDTNNLPGLELKDEIGVLSHSFKNLLQTVQEKQIITEKKAYIDGLTGIYNRNKLDEELYEEIKRINRYPHPLSMAIIDIDKFKDFNDTYGHLIGDEILVMIAQKINTNVRSTDVFARWGGEEFVILFKETSIKEALVISEKLKVEIQKVQHTVAGNITASFGLTQYIEGDTLKSIFKRCDDALYLAKNNGRNRIEVLDRI